MRITFIFAVVVAVTIHASTNALPSATISKAVTENEASPAIIDLTGVEDGRMLRRVEKGQDDSDEERGFSLQNFLAKLSPAERAARKAAKAEKAEKIREMVKEEGKHVAWLSLEAEKAKHNIK